MKIFSFFRSTPKGPSAAASRQTGAGERQIDKLTQKQTKLAGQIRKLEADLQKSTQPTAKALRARTQLEGKIAKLGAQLEQIGEKIAAKRETVADQRGFQQALTQNLRDDLDNRRIANTRGDDCYVATASALAQPQPQSVRAHQAGPKALLTPIQEAGANLIDQDSKNAVQNERARAH